MKPLRLLRLATFLFLLASPAVVAAQSVTALRADRHELSAQESLQLRFDRERGGTLEQAPWPEGFDWFLVRVSGTQHNLQDFSRSARSQEGTSFRLELPESGVTLVAADGKPRIETVAPRELRGFLRTRIGPATLPVDGPGRADDVELRVRRLESSKLLVRVLGDEGWLPNSATAQSKTGQRVEIRPMGDPTSVRLKTDMPLRVYVPNPEKAGTKVIARHLATGQSQSFLTDAEGTGHFQVTGSGAWLVEVHHARRLADDPLADWEIHTATLSFEVPSWDPRELEDQEQEAGR